MLQDPSKQRNLVPYTSARAFVRACSRANCVDFEIYQYDQPGIGFFGLVEITKSQGALLDMPRAAGFCILELSKLVMLRWHYDWFKALYAHLALLCMTDTDSLVYKITCKSITRDMLKAIGFYFDLQEALSPQDLRMITNGNETSIAKIVQRCSDVKGRLGAMKLENKTSFIQEFVGLAAKMYSLKMVGHADHNGNDKGDGSIEEYRKGKGVPTRALLANATHETYKQMIFNPTVNRVTFRTLRSQKHVVQQLEISRKMLTPYNDKVFAISQFESRPLGHYRNRKVIEADLTMTDQTTTNNSSSSSSSSSL
jgi:hypothetical protein